jgi:hypothetical protein
MSKMRVFFIRDERLNPDTFYPLYYQPKRFIKIILLIFWVPDPADVVPNIPEGLRQFILKACQRNLDRRFQTVTEALDALEHLGDELDITSKQPVAEKMNMTSLFMVYKENQQPAVKQLIKSLRAQAKELGIDLKSADLSDL